MKSPHERSKIRLPSLDEDVYSSGFFSIAISEILGISSNILQAQNIALVSMLQDIRQNVSILREQHGRLVSISAPENEITKDRTTSLSNSTTLKKIRSDETAVTKTAHRDNNGERSSISNSPSRNETVSDFDDQSEAGSGDDGDKEGKEEASDIASRGHNFTESIEASHTNDLIDRGKDATVDGALLKEHRDGQNWQMTVARDHPCDLTGAELVDGDDGTPIVGFLDQHPPRPALFVSRILSHFFVPGSSSVGV
ncbi:Hypothetical protein R9X50_00570900 [Acrodontium crateriforme]|uniref:Uncharacterized protein n=1 Tax=Acrodontium crateriforme TaxID=150365 RepID=A0AAQ3R667_9PEZI|nr:Hypothetical protein R9X50_00570900 [Acrodontium crateriforme]